MTNRLYFNFRKISYDVGSEDCGSGVHTDRRGHALSHGRMTVEDAKKDVERLTDRCRAMKLGTR